jgi:pimeloyl-ACP methyl ester carboxylesterase
MPDLAELYPDFAAHWIDTSIGRMFARAGGAGPPLLLLHGYPQSNVMYHRVAPALARDFSLVIADLPGYGWSAAPEAEPDHSPYTNVSPGMIVAGALATASRSIIPAASNGSPFSTSCRPTPCGTAWTATSR